MRTNQDSSSAHKSDRQTNNHTHTHTQTNQASVHVQPLVCMSVCLSEHMTEYLRMCTHLQQMPESILRRVERTWACVPVKPRMPLAPTVTGMHTHGQQDRCTYGYSYINSCNVSTSVRLAVRLSSPSPLCASNLKPSRLECIGCGFIPIRVKEQVHDLRVLGVGC